MKHIEFSEVLGLLRNGKNGRAQLEKFLLSVGEYGLISGRIAELALAIAESGHQVSSREFFPLSNVHSTGAPGSITTLLCPVLVASAGFNVPLLSVRGGIAGAIDSLSVIPGYRSGLNKEELRKVLRSSRLAHIGHGAGGFAPADSLLWQLREKTNTKKIPALIAASLLGKQLAMGVQHGSIDVRVGPAGNAGDSVEPAINTAYTLVDVARILGMRVTCVITDAIVPQWPRIGRIDSVLSVVDILSAPRKFKSHPHIKQCVLIAACACNAASPAKTISEWSSQIERALLTGSSLSLLFSSVGSHGGVKDWLVRLRTIANERRRIPIRLTSRIDSTVVREGFRKLRKLLSAKHHDSVGIEIVGERSISLLLPAGSHDLGKNVEHFFQGPQKSRRVSAIAPHILTYQGQLFVAKGRNLKT